MPRDKPPSNADDVLVERAWAAVVDSNAEIPLALLGWLEALAQQQGALDHARRRLRMFVMLVTKAGIDVGRAARLANSACALLEQDKDTP